MRIYPAVEALFFFYILLGAEYTAAKVEQDGNIITACGPGASFDFGFAIVDRFCGAEVVATLRSQMQF